MKKTPLLLTVDFIGRFSKIRLTNLSVCVYYICKCKSFASGFTGGNVK